jgi:serine phosphatase RsbU (regulator of sigma subunit)
MPARAQVAFYLGVFCCFAPLGLVVQASTLRVPPLPEVIFLTLYSGGIAIAFAAAATRAPKWLVLPIAVHVLVAVLVNQLTPDRPALAEVSTADAAALKRWLTASSALTVASLAGAFIAFAAMLRFEGLRFVSAHTEIRLAREIHATLVPRVDGRSARMEWRGVSRPSGDVGGDLVDVVERAGVWTAVVADVTGHGVAAGVVMGMFKTAFRGAVDDEPDTGALATRVNRVLAPLRQPHMFVTAACVRVADDKRVEFVLAGHPPILHLSAATGRATWVGEPALALTLIDRTVYEPQFFDAARGDVVIVLTDGLLEVFDAEDRELGADGIRLAVEKMGAGATLEQLESGILDVARRHGPQLDDQTLLLVRLLP